MIDIKIFRGERFYVYTCDGYYVDEICSEKGCRDATMNGISALLCCCDGDL